MELITIAQLSLVASFLLAFVITAILTPFAAWLSRRFNLVDAPLLPRKQHNTPKPYVGYIIVLIAMAIPSIAIIASIWLVEYENSIPEFLKPYEHFITGAASPLARSRLIALLTGALAMFVLGFVDDLTQLGPQPKLLAQFVAAVPLVMTGASFPLLESMPEINACLTIFWIVIVTNAFNLLDNMDGHSASIALIAAVALALIAFQCQQVFVCGWLAVIAGSLLGFLIHNWNPAKVFMGDQGALSIGFLLAGLTVFTNYLEQSRTIASFALPLLIMGVPIYDTISVFLVRWRKGQPLFKGDNNHLSHRLTRLGLSKHQAVIAVALLAVIMGGIAVLLPGLSQNWQAIVALIVGCAVFGLLALLEIAAARKINGEPPKS